MAWADHSNEIEPSSTDNLFLETDLYGQQNDKLHRRRWRLGLLILLLVLLLWLTSTFLLNVSIVNYNFLHDHKSNIEHNIVFI